MTPRKVTFIGVPLDLGAGPPGRGHGPVGAPRGRDPRPRPRARLRRGRPRGHGGLDRRDPRPRRSQAQVPEGDPPDLRRACGTWWPASSARAGCRSSSAATTRSPWGRSPGASQFHRERNKKKIGLVWFDAHGDMNTPDTSPTGNIHGMPLAVALGLGEKSLVDLGGERPMVGGLARGGGGAARRGHGRARQHQGDGDRGLHHARHRRARACAR